jgi:hypothetical protein
MKMDQSREKMPNGQIQRIVAHSDFYVVIRLQTDLNTSSSSAD